MGNDEDSGTGGQTCVGNGMLPETDGADSVDPSCGGLALTVKRVHVCDIL